MWFLKRNTDNQGYKVSSKLYYKRRKKQYRNPNPWNNLDEKANPKVTNTLFYAQFGSTAHFDVNQNWDGILLFAHLNQRVAE